MFSISPVKPMVSTRYLVAAAAMLLTACGNVQSNSDESAPLAGASVEHLEGDGRRQFRCEDGSELLVELGQGGRVIKISDQSGTPSLLLSARSAGGEYSSGSIGATLRGNRLHLDRFGGRERICQVRHPQ